VPPPHPGRAFIQRMQARGVHVGPWLRHPVTCTSQGRTEPVETFLSRMTGAPIPFSWQAP
jgi:hypothetical protein